MTEKKVYTQTHKHTNTQTSKHFRIYISRDIGTSEVQSHRMQYEKAISESKGR